MLAYLVLLLALTSSLLVSAFRIAPSHAAIGRKQHVRLLAQEDPFDTSEISTGSSTEFKARLLEAEALAGQERDAMLKRSRLLHESLAIDAAKSERDAWVASQPKAKAPDSPAPMMSAPKAAVTTTPGAAAAPAGLGEAMSTGGQAFDFGLIIAFPVIIGTLALFFIFPLIKDQIAAGLPPVPL